MPKIGLISDTHSHLDEAITRHLENCDEIWHAGDFGSLEVSERLAALRPLTGVYGNIDDRDIRLIHPEDQLFVKEDVKVYMTHIGGYPGRYNPRARAILDREKPDLFICGHSHIAKVQRDQKRGLLHINPGAAGHAGLHVIRTIMTLKIENGRMSDLNVIELGKRGR